MKKSCVQVYTGNGKGKTTAAMGLAVRAAGQGLTVKIVQFMKGRDTGELSSLGKLGIELVRASQSTKFFHTMNDEEKAALRESACDVLPLIDTWLDKIDLLIMDEALGALTCGVVKLDELLHIMDGRGGTEVVMTGRDAPDEIVERANLVTEMREVKHYMNSGVGARKGIEY
jgi:cob(I)alamin adenosyltransferase